MTKDRFADTHILLDGPTRTRLAEIAAWSGEAAGTSRTIRAIARKYHDLLRRQIEAEKEKGSVYLEEVRTGGEATATSCREKLDLKI